MSARRDEGVIEVLARGCLVRGGRVLLCHSKGAANTYLPGGHVEFREPARVALAREMEEELGVRVKVGRFLGAVEHAFVQKGRPHSEVNLLFEMRFAARVARLPPSCEEYIEFRWCPLSRLAAAGLEPFVLRRRLRRWLAGDAATDRWASTIEASTAGLVPPSPPPSPARGEGGARWRGQPC
jgi:8-oxo-dGTP pyrophosphatase MutT (NUDIX family)